MAWIDIEPMGYRVVLAVSLLPWGCYLWGLKLTSLQGPNPTVVRTCRIEFREGSRGRKGRADGAEGRHERHLLGKRGSFDSAIALT